MPTRFRVPRRPFRLGLVLLAMLLLAPMLAAQRAAACTIAAPEGSIGQTGTTITISWAYTCNAPAPTTIELIQGTTQWGLISNNPIGDTVGKISNNEAAMAPSMEYKGLQVCGGNGKILQYCSAPFPASTGSSGAQPGSDPMLTGLNVTAGSSPGSYNFSWTPSSAYTAYRASNDNGITWHEVYNPPVGFTLDPSTPYTFEVEGGIDHGFPAGIGYSNVEATLNYTTPAPPAPATLPPTGLQAMYQPPDNVRPAEIYVGWTEPGQSGVSEAPPARTPAWPQGYHPAISVTNSFHAFFDTAIAANTNYTYTICLDGAGGQACAQASVPVPAIPPSCKQTLICPVNSQVPGQIHYSCSAPVDFYSSPTPSITNATPLPPDSPTSYTGIDEVINPTYLIFCQQGSKSVCGVLLQNMAVTSCAMPPPKPVPPPPNCKVCIETNRQCKKVAGGYQCVGNAQ